MKAPQMVQDLLAKPMDRKEFLQHVAAIGLVVGGAGIFAQSLTGISKKDLLGSLEGGSKIALATRSMAYGSTPYGGGEI